MATKSSIIGYGDLALFEKLISRINEEFKSNPRYKDSLNSIDISVRNDGLYDMTIDTKYYRFECELHLTSSESDLKAKIENKVDDSTTIEGIIVAHCDKSSNTIKLARFEQFRDHPDLGALCLLIHFGGLTDAAKREAKNEMAKLNEDFVEFELSLEETEKNGKEKDSDDEDEDEFSSLDELINCFFVHSWENMKRKTTNDKEKNKNVNSVNGSEGSEVKVDKRGDEEISDEDDEFNVESLIANLSDLRNKASQMSFEERKMYAEKVVTGFWKSLGGDMAELGSLDDDED